MYNQSADVSQDFEYAPVGPTQVNASAALLEACLYLEITNICTNRCMVCPKGRQNGAAPFALALNDIRRIVLDAMERRRIASVTLSGGEPLLHAEIVEIIQWIASMGLQITLLTSLPAQTQMQWEQLQNLRDTLHVVVALHSAESELHDHITGRKGSHRSVIEGIERLIEHQINTTVKVIVSYRTCKELPGILNLLLTRWGRRIKLSLHGLDLCGAGMEGVHMLPVNYQEEGRLLNLFLAFAKTIYEREITRYIRIAEYPLCWIDPCYFELASLKRSGGAVAYSGDGSAAVYSLPVWNTCGPHSVKCRGCGIAAICDGTWYSVLRIYGDGMLKRRSGRECQ